ncbi:MAG: TonB-dependent receptor [Steroidobacteraceae bacterium]|nr:TonB-dependent receptor [Steroidobacteraceae bacterium]
MSSNNGWRHCLWMAPLTFAMASPVHGQSAGVDEELVLDEVVVTARKREENLQDVPIVVTAVSAEQLAREGIQNVEDLVARDPSLAFDLGIAPYDTRIVIRGLSPTRGRPNVATLIDGIDVSSEAVGVAGGSLLINPRLVDIARIEIVKGPQSALYGRSAFAGAISYVTADPDDELTGSFAVDANHEEQKELRASISLPLTDTLGVRLNGYLFDDRGFFKNSTTGAWVGGGNGVGGSMTVKWQPNEVYSVKFRSEYADDNFDPPAQASVPFNTIKAVPSQASSCRTYSIANPGPTPNPALVPNLVATGPVLDASCQNLDANPNFRTAAGVPITGAVRNPAFLLESATGFRGIYDDMGVPSYRGVLPDASGLRVTYNPDYTRSTDNGVTAPEFSGTNRQVTRLSAVQSLDFDFGSFSSLTGYTRALVSTSQDFDKLDLLSVQQTLKTDNTTEQFSQELRFTSDFDGPLQFITGLQYWTERADQFDRNNTVFGAGSTCVLVAVVPGATPMGVCAGAPGTTGFTSTSVAPFMDDVANARRPSFVRRLVEHQSAYLELEWTIAERLSFIAEARYVDETNEIAASPTAGNQGPGTAILCGATGNCNNLAAIPYPAAPGAPGTFAGPTQFPVAGYSRSESYVTPKGTIQWRARDNLNVYASYSEGRKPGGFATLTTGAFGLPARSDVEFESEKIAVYELGSKWTSENRRLQLNGAYFFQDFTDKQVSTQVIVGTTLGNRVTNAGGAELQGLELAATWRATENLNVGLGVTHFLQYEYTDFNTLTSGAAEIARVNNCEIVTTVVQQVVAGVPTNVAQTTCRVSRTGNKLEDTPETSVALNLGWRQPLGASGNSLFVDFDTFWLDERFAEDDNAVILDSYYLSNLRIGVENERWSAQLYVDNLFDDDTIRSGGTGPGNAIADVRQATITGAVQLATPTTPVNLRQPVPAFGLAIPTAVFAQLPNPRLFGVRFNYKF